MGHIRNILLNPRLAASKGLLASVSLCWRLALVCVVLYAPRSLLPFRSWDSGFFSWLNILFQELFLVGVMFALFAVFFPFKFMQYIVKVNEKEVWTTPDFANITLFTLLIYLFLNFPFNIFSLFLNMTEFVYTLALIAHGSVAVVFAAIWLYKVLVPAYLESGDRATRIIIIYLIAAVTVTVIIVLNFDFIWLMITSPKGGIR